MDEKQLFGMALGLTPPWFIDKVSFDPGQKRLDLFLDFKRGAKFLCPECGDGGEGCPVHDTTEKTWRHLDFFQHQAFLTARVPRIECKEHGVRLTAVPWARPGSGFTLLFEALALLMCQEMPVSGAAKLMRCNANTMWRLLSYYVEAAVEAADYSGVKSVGTDECARQKGHSYITTFCDLDRSRVVFVADGRRKTTFKEFRAFLEKRGIDPTQIEKMCMDMWEPYRMGAAENFPTASVTFDRYHVMTLFNRAIDQVRRKEVRSVPLLRGSRHVWLKNRRKLTARQAADLERLSLIDSKTARAYQIKLTLQRFWQIEDPAEAESFLKKWYFWATHSRLEPVIEAAKTIKRHWKGILQFVTSRITTGIVEGLNSKIKTATKRAYGFKSFEYLRTVIYLVAGKINIALPTQS
jgi:transposase